MCGRLRVGKGFLHVCSVGRCSHVFGLLVRHTWPLAIMPSADQVPVISTHSTMRWHKWGVLIAGSTGSALRAVRPFQPSHHAGCPTRSRLRRECDGFLVALATGHHSPGHPRNLVGKRDGSDLRWSPHQQCRQTTKIFRNIPNLFSVATRWRFGTKTQQPPRGRLCKKLHIFSASSWLRG